MATHTSSARGESRDALRIALWIARRTGSVPTLDNVGEHVMIATALR